MDGRDSFLTFVSLRFVSVRDTLRISNIDGWERNAFPYVEARGRVARLLLIARAVPKLLDLKMGACAPNILPSILKILAIILPDMISVPQFFWIERASFGISPFSKESFSLFSETSGFSLNQEIGERKLSHQGISFHIVDLYD
jgi:hypothetical protein